MQDQKTHISIMPKKDGHWEVANEHAPEHGVLGHGCKNDSLVALWDSRPGKDSCFGRANLEKNIKELQGYFPCGGKEHNSQEIGEFKVLVKTDDTDYHWVRMCVLEKNPGKYHPLDIDGSSPCCINGIIGKVNVEQKIGHTGCDGKESKHEGEEMEEAWVLCVRKA